MQTSRKNRHNFIFWAAVAILVILYYGWRLQMLNTFPLEYDEGIHLILGKLWAAGYTPYREIFVSYPPYFMWSLGLPWKLFAQTGALQLLMTTYALAGVLAVVYLGKVYNSRLAGLTAGILLSFSPAYFIDSLAIMTEIPSISMAVAGIALAEKYRRDGGWAWVLATGITLGFGLSLKILPYYAIPLVGLIIISRHISLPGTGPAKHQPAINKILFRDLAVVSGGFLATFLLPIFLFDLPAFYQQVVGMRLVSRETDFNPFDSNNSYILDFLFGNPGLTSLALYGLVFVVARRLRYYWVLVAWFIFTWLAIYFLVPLRAKHLPIFLPALALPAGFAVNHIYRFLKQLRKENLSLRAAAMLLTIIVVLGMFIWSVPDVVAQNSGQTINQEENKERLAAIDFIDKIALPTDCVIADNPVFLYQTHRLPPPELSETSQTRIDTGHLTPPDVIQAIEKHKCHVVAVVTPRFGETMPGLLDWLAQHYLGLYSQSETFVYFAPKGYLSKSEINGNVTPVSNGSFGELVNLAGVLISEQPWSNQNGGYISLIWQLQSPIENQLEYTITLRGGDSQAHQIKRLPFAGKFNPANWQVGEQVRDTFKLDLPANLPPGTYDLYLSLCTPNTARCLVINRQTETHLGQLILPE